MRQMKCCAFNRVFIQKIRKSDVHNQKWQWRGNEQEDKKQSFLEILNLGFFDWGGAPSFRNQYIIEANKLENKSVLLEDLYKDLH